MSSRERLLGLGASLLLVLHALAYLYWTEDDAAISFRYTDNLVGGQGLVYNPGERVEAISNLGYVLLLAPFQALVRLAGGPEARLALLVVAKLLGLLAALAGLREAARLGATLGLGPGARSFLLVLVAGSAPYTAWAVGGLETPFVAWLSAALLAGLAELAVPDPGRITSRAALSRAGAAATGLVLLRSDGFVLPVIAAGAALVLLRRPGTALRMLAGPAVAFAALTGFRLAYYGRWWPNPVGAKIDLYASLAAAPGTLLHYVLPFFNLHGGPVALAALAVAVLGTGEGVRPRRVVAASVAGVCAYVTAVGGDWMPLSRFLAPLVVPLLALLVAAAQRFQLRRLGPVTLATLALGLGAGEALAGRASFHRNRAARFWYFEPTLSPARLAAFWLPAVDWLRDRVPRGSTLLTSEAGFIPWLSGLRTVDSYGLADPTLAALPRGSVERSPLGIHTRFIAGPPADAAQRHLATLPAAAVVLQDRMVKTWNDGVTPGTLFAGRYRLDAASPAGGLWAVYLPGPPP